MTLGGQSSESKPHSDYLGAPLPATAMSLNRNSFDPSIPTHNAPSMPNSGTDSIVFDNVQAEDDDEDDEGHKKTPAKNKHAGRRKIKIEYITDKTRRHITFSKRKAGIMKKAYELSTLTGTQVLLLVVSETGLVYTFTTPKLQPLVTKPEGKNLIQACLNAQDGPGEEESSYAS
ncbi:hypothetical protein VTP01DRAFT_207 [Rhizomucor pusillus]|uniref:uncharacterized protein n=1 Tax=Rhizomucor pusillus TaxID=4840 RepID=UPI0037425B79